MAVDREKKLNDTAARIEAQITTISDSIQAVTKTSKTNRKMILGIGLSLVLDLILTTAMAFGLVSLNNNSGRLDDVTSTLNSEVTTQRVEALCPLYQLFINSDTAASRENARVRGDDMEIRDKAYTVIHRSYDVLHCSDFIGVK